MTVRIRSAAPFEVAMKIYIVIADSNDECTCGNRAFHQYENAWKYLCEYEEESGCRMKIMSIEFGDE